MSWELLEGDDIPDWVGKAASKDRGNNPQVVGKEKVYHGETFVYKVEFGFGNHGRDYTFYRQLKSDYFETTADEGTCPNCQEYVRRLDGDDYLTCHRCGWQYKPLKEQLKNLL